MRKSLATAVAATVLTVVVWGGNSQAANRDTVGAVEKVQREAQAEYVSDVRALTAQAPILYDDLVKTGEGARLLANLADGTQITLGENARLLVDDFVYTPGAEGGKLALDVVKGAFLFVGGAIEGPTGGNVEITTPVGTLGVRGTTVWGGAIDGGYGVLVLDGQVTVSTGGGEVTLNAGEATMIGDRTQAPAAPHTWSEEKTARAVATISFAN